MALANFRFKIRLKNFNLPFHPMEPANSKATLEREKETTIIQENFKNRIELLK